MAFPEWGFILIPSLPCALVNCSYLLASGFLGLSMLFNFFFKTRKYKCFEKLNSEVRSLLPLFKEGSSAN